MTMNSGRTYTNVALTGVVVLLGVIAVKPPAGSAAFGQPGVSASAEDGKGLASAIDQRKQMIAELKNLSKRLEKVEATLSKGVKVTEMPELKLPQEFRDAMKARAAESPRVQ